MKPGVADSLHGALLLARGRPEGLPRMAAAPGEEMAVAARSFLAVPICLPAFLGLHLVDWTVGTMPSLPTRTLSSDLIGFAIGWAGFALASHGIAAAIGRAETWPRFITAWNWCTVVQYLMLLGAGVLAVLGAPFFVVQSAWLVALGWAMWLEWFATRLALDVPGGTAAGLVLLDFALGMLVVGLLG